MQILISLFLSADWLFRPNIYCRYVNLRNRGDIKLMMLFERHKLIKHMRFVAFKQIGS